MIDISSVLLAGLIVLGGLAVIVAACLPRANTWIAHRTAVSTLPIGQLRAPAWIDTLLQAAIGVILAISVAGLASGHLAVGTAWLGFAIWFGFIGLRFGLHWLLASQSEFVLTQAAAAEIAGHHANRPRFAFYFSAPDLNQPTHVLMWYDELRVLEIPFMIIVREQKHLRGFPENPQIPVLFVRKEAGLMGALPDGLKAVFYANNGQKNRQLIKLYPQVEHVQLLHGDSDKPPSYSPLSKNYNKLFVAGQMAVDRYATNGVSIPSERFRIVGRPQVARISQAQTSDTSQKGKVAYMPTWRGFFADTQFSSLEAAPDVAGCVHGLNHPTSLLFKPHPMSYKDPLWPDISDKIKREIADHNQNGSAYFGDETDPFDLYNRADVLITDISSVMIDFLYSGKPYLVIKPKGFTDADLVKFPSLSGGYLVESDLGNLTEQLELALGPDPMQKRRLDVRAYAFGDIARRPGEAFQDACRELIDDAA